MTPINPAPHFTPVTKNESLFVKYFIWALPDQLTLERKHDFCPFCHTGFFPKDRALGIEKASVTSGVLRMIGTVGSERSFEKGTGSSQNWRVSM
ncbi:MAG: hypothetical protein ACYC9S_09410 [Leptospirales bacterium]